MKGQVTLKYKGPGDDQDGSDDDEDSSDDDEDAAFKLKRLVKKNGKQSVSAELTLAEIAHGPSSRAPSSRSSEEFTTLQFDFTPGNNPDSSKFWQTRGEGKGMSGLNYNLDPQVSLQPHNCEQTHTHTHTPIRAGDLALYYYVYDGELTFQGLHVEVTVVMDT